MIVSLEWAQYGRQPKNMIFSRTIKDDQKLLIFQLRFQLRLATIWSNILFCFILSSFNHLAIWAIPSDNKEFVLQKEEAGDRAMKWILFVVMKCFRHNMHPIPPNNTMIPKHSSIIIFYYNQISPPRNFLSHTDKISSSKITTMIFCQRCRLLFW